MSGHSRVCGIDKRALLMEMLDKIQLAFPPFDAIFVECTNHRNANDQRQIQLTKDYNQLSTRFSVSNTVYSYKLSLTMLKRIVHQWITNGSGTCLVILLRQFLESNGYYGRACNFILRNLDEQARNTLIKKVVLLTCTINSAPPAINELPVLSHHLVAMITKSVELARTYFRIKGRLGCLQLRVMSIQEHAVLRLFLLDPHRRPGESHRWQIVLELKTPHEGSITVIRLFTVIDIRRVVVSAKHGKGYELSLVWCTHSCVYFTSLTITISSVMYVSKSSRIFSSCAPVGFLNILFDQQRHYMERDQIPTHFSWCTCLTHKQPYLLIASSYFPILFAVADTYLEMFFLSRNNDESMVTGVLTCSENRLVVTTTKGKAYLVNVETRADKLCLLVHKLNVSMPITPLLTMRFKDCTYMLEIEDQYVWTVDITAKDDLLVHKKSISGDTFSENLQLVLEALTTICTSISSPIYEIISVGTVKILTNLSCCVLTGRFWDGIGFLAIQTAGLWHFQFYQKAASIACFSNKKSTILWTLFDDCLICGPS